MLVPPACQVRTAMAMGCHVQCVFEMQGLPGNQHADAVPFHAYLPGSADGGAASDGGAYRHEWRAGDFLIVDNLAVAHFAPPETQQKRDAVGLRVLDRVVVAGVDKLAPLMPSPPLRVSG